MANSGPNTNGCQVSSCANLYSTTKDGDFFFLKFFITTAKCDFLDGKHVVFGKVIDGMLTLRKIENVATGPNNRPKLVVKITGEFSNDRFCSSNVHSCISRVWRNVDISHQKSLQLLLPKSI